MKTMKNFFTALMIVASLTGMSVYSTSAVAMGGVDATFGGIAAAIDNALELLKTARKAVEGDAEGPTVLKLMDAARQESKEVTGDNFGAYLQFANDDLKRARKAVKYGHEKDEQLEKIDAAIAGFTELKKRAK